MAVERLHAENYDEFIDFADQVFSQDLIRVHFQEDMPLLFGPDEKHMQMQYAYRDETGRIRSVIGVIPYIYRVGEEQFSVRTITNVATHYRHTGRGYMQTVFRRVLEDMQEEGVDLALLHGNRERYRNYGFEMAGTTHVASFQSYNIPNRKKRGEQYPYTFREITEDDHAWIRECLSLYRKNPQGYERSEEKFLDFQHMWEGKAYAVCNPEGKFCGYLNYYQRFGKAIREIFLREPHTAAQVIYSFLQAMDLQETSVYFTPFDEALDREIFRAAEYVLNEPTTRLKLLRPERFLEACLNLKKDLGATMPEGRIILNSSLGNLQIENSGRFTVKKTGEKENIRIANGDIYSVLFGPEPVFSSPYYRKMGELFAWFPLPLHIPYTDLY